MTVTILHEKCEIDAAKDKTLPNTAYLVEYKVEGKTTYDIAISQKAADLFDHYYDKFKKDFVKFKQADGIANPKCGILQVRNHNKRKGRGSPLHNQRYKWD